jgi:ABC-type amino acid transport substrate-binding protein
VQLVGDDPSTTPPGLALARRGAVEHVVGYPVLGDTPSAARAAADVAAGRLDAAILWGPQAGYFASRSPVAVRVATIDPPRGSGLRFDFAIAMGVRRGDNALRDALDAALARRAADIHAILAAYGVPQQPLDGAPLHAMAGARP